MLLEKRHPNISVTRQCSLLGIARSTAYYASEVNTKDLVVMKRMDEIFTAHPYYGKRRLHAVLCQEGYKIGIKKIRTLMATLGLIPLYPKPKTSVANKDHPVYPYLLRNVPVKRVNQVWSTDITYIRLEKGFVYLTAIVDWYSRYVLSWKLSLTLETDFCTEALQEALSIATPDIFNSDQGCQYTSVEFQQPLLEKNISISMDSTGRCLDNIFVERLWRTVKYEEVYLKHYDSPSDAYHNLHSYFYFYNHQRPHQSLKYKTPAQIYFQSSPYRR